MNKKPSGHGLSLAGAGNNHSEWVLKEGERLLSTLSQISTLGIFLTDVAGNYLYVNDRWCMITGLKQKDALAGGWARAIHPDDRDYVAKAWYTSKQAGLNFILEYRIQRPDGSVRWVLGQAAADRDAAGEAAGYIGTITDITHNRQTEEEYQRFFNLIPDLACIASTDGRFLKINRRWQDILGYTDQEILATPFLDLIHPDDRDATTKEMGRQLAGESTMHFTNRYRCADGSYRWLEWRASPAVDGKLLFASARDITERKKSEEQLKHSEEMLRAYLDNVSDTIWLIDANMNMAYVSPSVTSLLGVSPEELIGRPSILVIHPDDMGAIDNAMRYVMEHPGEPHTIQYRVCHKDGRWVYVESTSTNMLGNPVINGVLVAMRDITQRKLAEDALRASEHRYRLLVESSPICIHEIDLEGRMQSMNRAGLNMLGLDDEEKICGLPYLEAVSRQDAGRIGGLLQDAINNGKSSFFEFASSGEAARYFKSCFVPIKDAGGKVLEVMGLTEDITERNNIEHELKQTKERYDYATEIGKVGIWDWNTVTNDLNWSDETFRLLGFQPGSVTPSYELFLDKVHPDDREFLNNAVQAAQRDKKPYVLDCRLVPGSGEELACHISGKVEFDANDRPVRMLGTIHDISERKRLEQGKEQFLKFFRLSTDLMCIADPFGCFKQVNPAFTQLTGFSESELVSKPFMDFVFPEDRQKTADEMKLQISERPSMHFENRYVCKDGRIIFLSWTAYFDKNEGITYATARDITDRKMVENALAESERRFREIFNTVSDAIFIHEVETGRIIDVNRRMLEMYGLTHEEALACDVSDLSAGTPPYSASEAVEKIHLARTDGPQTFVWLARARDGHLFWVEVSLQFALIGSQQRILATVRDIPERKKAEAALRESEFRWKFALEGSGDGLWDWNLADNTVFFSKRWKEMLGFAEDEISNSLDEWKKRIHPDDKANTLVTVQAYLNGKTPVYQSEHRVSCKDGSWKWILDRGMVVSRNEQGKPLRMIGTHTDITERKHAEEQIHNLAYYDTLTQLPNRRMLSDRMNLAMASSKRSSRYCALLFLDLDNFKPLNDTYGHAVGDVLLKEVARRIGSCVREMDTVARFGGDEFVVMLTELGLDKVESAVQAGIVAEKIRIILAQPYMLKVQQEGKAATVEHHCTSSIGVVLFIGHEDSPEDITKWADMAMYQAKEDGRNLIRFYASGD